MNRIAEFAKIWVTIFVAIAGGLMAMGGLIALLALAVAAHGPIVFVPAIAAFLATVLAIVVVWG